MLLKVTTPRAEKLSVTVDELAFPAALGEMGVMPGHTPLMTVLDVGVLSYKSKNGTARVAVNRGFVEVLDDTIRVLTETCETDSEIDVERARKAYSRADERIKKAPADSSIDVLRAEYSMKRALARLSAAGSSPA
jgi:F-type H+-transporting ATPase subunit epsilon